MQTGKKMFALLLFRHIVRVALDVEHHSLHQQAGHDVGVAVGRGAAVLRIAAAVLVGLARNANRGAAVGHSVREHVDRGSLVATSQTALQRKQLRNKNKTKRKLGKPHFPVRSA